MIIDMAVKDGIRAKKKGGIKAMAGKMRFTKGTADLRHEDERLGTKPSGSTGKKPAVPGRD